MITEEQLREAALELDDALLADLQEYDALEPSPRFERKMKRLLRRKSPSRWKGYCLRAAAVLLTVLLFGGVVILSSPETLAEFKGLFYEYNEEENEYHYVQDGWVEPEDVKDYRLGWVPEGYAFKHGMNRYYRGFLVYGNQEKKTIHFSYEIRIGGDQKLFLSHGFSSDYKLESTIVNGRGADLFVLTNKDGSKSYKVIWMNEERSVLFSVSNARSEEEAVRMAESVEELELQE